MTSVPVVSSRCLGMGICRSLTCLPTCSHFLLQYFTSTARDLSLSIPLSPSLLRFLSLSLPALDNEATNEVLVRLRLYQSLCDEPRQTVVLFAE